jgi:hypothetical protein
MIKGLVLIALAITAIAALSAGPTARDGIAQSRDGFVLASTIGGTNGKPKRQSFPEDQKMAQGCNPRSSGYCGEYDDTYYCCPDRSRLTACINYRGTGRVVWMTDEDTPLCSFVLNCSY